MNDPAAMAGEGVHSVTWAGGAAWRGSYWTLADSRHPAGPHPLEAARTARNATRRQPDRLGKRLRRLTPRRNIVGKRTTSSGRWQAKAQDIARDGGCRAGPRPAGETAWRAGVLAAGRALRHLGGPPPPPRTPAFAFAFKRVWPLPGWPVPEGAGWGKPASNAGGG